MKVVIFGSNGYLGGYFKRAYPDALTPIMDICHLYNVSAYLKENRPDVVINCAGKTGRPNIDWCETNRQVTLHSNVTGAMILAELCLEYRIYYVHIGSGCIYDGCKDYDEDAPPNFFDSFYSRTKAAVDILLHQLPVLNLRIRMPFDGSMHPRNLIMKLMGYPRVLTALNSMTYIPDFIAAAWHLINGGYEGTFNVVNDGLISPYVIMTKWHHLSGYNKFDPLHVWELPDVAHTGRSNCTLSNKRLKDTGAVMSPVGEAVDISLTKIHSVWSNLP